MQRENSLDELSLLANHVYQIFGSYEYQERVVGDATVRIAHGVEARDDCAVIQIGDVALVVGTDYVRGTEFALFRRGLLDYRDIGYFLAVANISDVASMGAIPFALLTVLRYSSDMPEDGFRSVLEGLSEAGKCYNTPVVGGDTGGAKEVVLSATALGFCGRDEYLLRQAEEGQHLCLTGSIGRAIAARVYFERAKPSGFRLKSELEDDLITAWKRPEARINECYIIRKHAKACQDVSDGLKATVEQITSSGSLGAEIYENELPIDESTRRVADFYKIPHAQLAMSASPDFELLFSVPERRLNALKHQFDDNQYRLSIIGNTNNTGECTLVSNGGNYVSPLPGVAWRSQWGSLIDEIVGGQSDFAE